MNAGVVVVDNTHSRLRGRRWPLVRRFGVASDQQYGDLNAGTRRSPNQPTNGRAKPAIYERRELGSKVEDSHVAKAPPCAPRLLQGHQLDIAKCDATSVCLKSDEAWDGVGARQASIGMKGVGTRYENEGRNQHAVQGYGVVLALHLDLERVPLADGIHRERVRIVGSLEAVNCRRLVDRQSVRSSELVDLHLKPEVDADECRIVVIPAFRVGKAQENAGICVFLPATPFEA